MDVQRLLTLSAATLLGLAAQARAGAGLEQCDLSTLAEVYPQGRDVAVTCAVDVYLGSAYYDYEGREELGDRHLTLVLETEGGDQLAASVELVEELSIELELRDYDPLRGCKEVIVGTRQYEVRHYRLTPATAVPVGSRVMVIDRSYPSAHGKGITHGRFATTTDASRSCSGPHTLQVPKVCFLSDSCVECERPPVRPPLVKPIDLSLDEVVTAFAEHRDGGVEW